MSDSDRVEEIRARHARNGSLWSSDVAFLLSLLDRERDVAEMLLFEVGGDTAGAREEARRLAEIASRREHPALWRDE